MYLAYLDDSNRQRKQSDLQVLSAVIIEDKKFQEIEMLLGVNVEQLIPEEKMDLFEEFHAAELYTGHGVFDGIDQAKRFSTIEAILAQIREQELPVVYGAVDVSKLHSEIYGSANPVDIAFRICAEGIDKWINDNDSDQFALLISDDFTDKQLKAELKRSFRQLRNRFRPPEFSYGKLEHVHDDMYFGDSKDSVGIQMADICAYFIRKHHEGDLETERYYNIIKDQIIYSQVMPS